jgi:uncharacterized membrane protein
MPRPLTQGSSPFGSPAVAADNWIGTSVPAVADLRWSRALLAFTMIGLGVIGFIFGDFALVWQRIPVDNLPAREFFAYLCAAVELAAGFGLLFAPTSKSSSGVLAVFLLLWVILLKLPAIVAVPSMEATWLGFGEIAVIFAGAWVLYAVEVGQRYDGAMKFVASANAIRYARLVFALSLPMIGLSHFFYSEQTVAFVPAWLPYKLGWAYLTGAGSVVASVAILLGVLPRLAGTLEAAMLTVITLLVWGPGLFKTPGDRTQWTAFFISMAIAAGAWLVADSYRGSSWVSFERFSSKTNRSGPRP